MNARLQRGTLRAFSLIEVTIAMAIAAVALVTIMGMIPQGMSTMREAGDEAITARIHQQILNELQMADFAALDDYNDREFFYDGQGEEIGNNMSGGSSAKGSLEHIYSAKVTIPNTSGGMLPETVGNSTFDGVSFDKKKSYTDLVRPIIIEVAAVAGLGANFEWTLDNRHMIRTYQTMVVKMGRSFN
jgi:uncharacterized protein (TIGR02598 family)